MLVRHVMTDIVQFVGPTATLREVLATFDEEEIRHMPVLEGDALVGIISDRDIRALSKVYVAPGEESILDSPVRDYMHKEVVSIEPEAKLTSAIDMLLHLRVGAIPVIDPKSKDLVGILSYVDVIKMARPHFK